MAMLPPGWWTKNANGTFTGPAPLEDDRPAREDGDESEDDATDDVAGLDIRPDSPGWEDMEPDTEALSVECLLCTEDFPSTDSMLAHCKTSHSFDFVSTVKSAKLDFYQTIKYINFIRSNTQNAVKSPTVMDSSALASDDLLKPVLENDALLFSLVEIVDFDEPMEDATGSGQAEGAQR